jgi:AcrR family transcriptional regulator
MARPREYDEALRVRLIDTAGILLATGGPEAVTIRRVAHEAGTSTNAIYTLIGSKRDIVRSMYREGFERLGRRLEAVPRGQDPAHHVLDLGRAYLESAIEDPHLYAVMFSNPVPEFRPNESDAAFAFAKLSLIIDAVQDCVDAGIFTGPAYEITTALWAIPHGLATLTNVRMITPPHHAFSLYENLARAAIEGFRSTPCTWPEPPSPNRPFRSARVVIDDDESYPDPLPPDVPKDRRRAPRPRYPTL